MSSPANPAATAAPSKTPSSAAGKAPGAQSTAAQSTEIAIQAINKRVDRMQQTTQQQLDTMSEEARLNRDSNTSQFASINKTLQEMMQLMKAHSTIAESSAETDDGRRHRDDAQRTVQPEPLADTPAPPRSTVSGSEFAGFGEYSGGRYQASRQLHDLPKFSGSPLDWPNYLAMFQQSSQAYGYSELDNNIRLRRSLVGDAKEAVECLLLDISATTRVMEALERRFGRPELLVQAQLRRVREILPIPEARAELIITFASRVANMLAFLDKPKTSQYLLSPELLEQLVQKLPLSRRHDWGEHAVDIEPYATIRHFSAWLDKLARSVSYMTPASVLAAATELPTISNRPKSTGAQLQQQNKSRDRILHVTNNNNDCKCSLCNAPGHESNECRRFLRLNVAGRWDLVRSRGLCFCCLQHGHGSASCAARKQCGVGGCTRSHHEKLHQNPFTSNNNQRQSTAEVEETPSHAPNDNTNSSNSERLNLGRIAHAETPRVLFRIVPVQLIGPSTTINTFALYDEGSSVSLMEQSLADELKLTGPEGHLDLQWFGSRYASETSRTVAFEISGVGFQARRYQLTNVRTIRKLDLPVQTVDMGALREQHAELRGLPVSSYVRAVPKILIGVDHVHLGVALRHVCCAPPGPLATKTRLGWTVCGPLQPAAIPVDRRRLLMTVPVWLDELHQSVKHYFSIESIGVYRPNSTLESREDKRAREIMTRTTARIGNRFETGLVWRNDLVRFPDSKPMATNRLQSLERKMGRDSTFAAQYNAAIDGFIASGYARRLSAAEAACTNERTWYLPHFAALNPNKPGKIRVVFDAAATVNGVSLNSALLKGPDLNRPLVAVLHQFRMGAVGVCADIKEMFLQVRIRNEDVNSQRFLWRQGKSDRPMETYVMESMIFGAACSPSSAQYVKNMNADENGDGQAEAVELIKVAHYVDDFVCSFGSAEEAIRISKAVVAIHLRGGFDLRRFVSNVPEVVEAIGGGEPTSLSLDMQLDPNTADKILGMYWSTQEDAFLFRLAFNRVDGAVLNGGRRATKRELLSTVMSIYDPFGILANYTIYGKLLLQDVWRHGTGWDEPVQDDIHQKWLQWLAKLEECRAVRVPRCYAENLLRRPVQLHIFADSSQSAMAAVAYWRIQDSSTHWTVSFIIGKARGAPPKLISVPRLELQAAILAVRLNRHIRALHKLRIDRTFFWTDSKTVVHWVRSNRSQFPPFVAHRIAEIWEDTAIADWHWIPTLQNPADDATRAKYPMRFVADNRWVNGPDFLRHQEDEWPAEPAEMPCEDGAEQGQTCSVHLVCTKVNLPVVQFTRFSDLFRAIRSMAYALRFTKNLRADVKTRGPLLSREIEDGERHLVRAVQAESFPEELTALTRGEAVTKGSAIRELMPHIDRHGVMRVGGRIDRADFLPEDARKPMILPKNHHFTTIMVAWYHRRLRHQQHEAAIGEIRQKYWVPHLRTVLRRVRSTCAFCRIKNAQPVEPVMGQLPIDRLTPYIRPFTYTGVDYFGPLYVTVGRRREKRWVALFTCMTVRACHLELASDLSTDAFMLCLRNFINIRGTPKRIRSDNGTNFVGANRELREAIDLLDHAAIQQELSVDRIEWSFNCPNHPQAGGCWERLVQCIKRVLSSTVKEVAPKVETLRSLLIEAANIVNSRPLTHLPVSSEDDEPLTPNHFILGCSSSTQTPGPDDNKLLCMRKQWRVAQALKNRFWKRWLLEYLPDLTRRAKGYDDHPAVQVGSLVLVCDPLLPRGKWRRGRIAAVYTGIDNRIRTALVKTADGEIKRPVSKLAVLDVGVGES